MRWIDISGGLRITVNNEEYQLIEKIYDNPLKKNELNEREQEVARILVNRGILIRVKDENEKIKFRYNKLQDLWRY